MFFLLRRLEEKLICRSVVGILFVVGSITLAFYFLAWLPNKNLGAHLKQYAGINIPLLNNYRISEKETSNFSGMSLEYISANKNGALALVHVLYHIDAALAKSYIQSKETSIINLFNTSPAPYPGAITKEILCPQEFHPVFSAIDQDKYILEYYKLGATNRLTYGACASDLIAYKAMYGFLYCKKSQNLFQFELFKPVSDTTDFLEKFPTFECR